jgi:hypothetical protein
MQNQIEQYLLKLNCVCLDAWELGIKLCNQDAAISDCIRVS